MWRILPRTWPACMPTATLASAGSTMRYSGGCVHVLVGVHLCEDLGRPRARRDVGIEPLTVGQGYTCSTFLADDRVLRITTLPKLTFQQYPVDLSRVNFKICTGTVLTKFCFGFLRTVGTGGRFRSRIPVPLADPFTMDPRHAAFFCLFVC